MASSQSKCPACGERGYDKTTINGHTACSYCDGEFCFGCGSHPVETLGHSGVCKKCLKKRKPQQAFESLPGFKLNPVISDSDVEKAIAYLHQQEDSGAMTEDEEILIYELELGGHYKSNSKRGSKHDIKSGKIH